MSVCVNIRPPLGVLAACLVLFLGACSSDRRTVLAEPALVAKRYAQERFGFRNPHVGSVGVLDEEYSVWVWDEPRKPGGFVIIHVSRENRVTGWDPGR
jgi:hypothetical protein